MSSITGYSVTIGARSFLPWSSQSVWVDDKPRYTVQRPISLTLGRLVVKDLQGNLVFSLRKSQPFIPTYFMSGSETSDVIIRKASPGYWVCSSDNCCWEVHRYSSIKCIVTTEGRQIAIISLSASLPFMNDGKVYLRVHDGQHLNISVAAALLIDGFGINLNPILLNNNKVIVTPAQSV
jgi:hypothetical protein